MSEFDVNPGLEPIMAEQIDSQLGVTDVELPAKVYEIGAQVGAIILGIEEVCTIDNGCNIRRFRQPAQEDGSQRLVMEADEYPGRGVIRPVTSASITRLDNGLFQYYRGTETSHNYDGSFSSESIVTARDDIKARVIERPGYSSRQAPQPKEYTWRNAEHKPFITNALDRLSQGLDSWQNETIARLNEPWDKRGAQPMQFRYNILPFEQRRRSL